MPQGVYDYGMILIFFLLDETKQLLRVCKTKKNILLSYFPKWLDSFVHMNVHVHVQSAGNYSFASHANACVRKHYCKLVLLYYCLLIISLILYVLDWLLCYFLHVPDKPPTEELHQFLEFQLPRQWAPMFSDLPLGPQRKQHSTASLQFTFMGPKLYVNTSVVIT